MSATECTVREGLAAALAEQMLDGVPDLPESWRDHVAKQMVAKLLSVDDGFDQAGAADVAREQLWILSGLAGGPEYSQELLVVLFPGACGGPDRDEDAVGDIGAHLRASIANNMVKNAVKGLSLPGGTAQKLTEKVLIILNESAGDALDIDACRNVLRQEFFALARHGLQLERAELERRLAAA